MKNLFIEIADTYEKREHGLMKRKHMAQNQGMLFRFPQPSFHSFWMKDTYIPLDIAFIDDDGKILQIESMVPLSTKAIYSKNQCRYALEVNKGWFKENGITVECKIDGEGIRKHKIIAQMTTPPISGAVPGVPEAIPGQPPTGESAPQPTPDIMLNLTYKERIKNANIKSQDLIIIYQTKRGKVLPPKVISPPYEFEEDENGHHEAIIKAWDNQTSGWKSFLIDNILNLEEQK